MQAGVTGIDVFAGLAFALLPRFGGLCCRWRGAVRIARCRPAPWPQPRSHTQGPKLSALHISAILLDLDVALCTLHVASDLPMSFLAQPIQFEQGTLKLRQPPRRPFKHPRDLHDEGQPLLSRIRIVACRKARSGSCFQAFRLRKCPAHQASKPFQAAKATKALVICFRLTLDRT